MKGKNLRPKILSAGLRGAVGPALRADVWQPGGRGTGSVPPRGRSPGHRARTGCHSPYIPGSGSVCGRL